LGLRYNYRGIRFPEENMRFESDTFKPVPSGIES